MVRINPVLVMALMACFFTQCKKDSPSGPKPIGQVEPRHRAMELNEAERGRMIEATENVYHAYCDMCTETACSEEQRTIQKSLFELQDLLKDAPKFALNDLDFFCKQVEEARTDFEGSDWKEEERLNQAAAEINEINKTLCTNQEVTT